MGNLPGNPHYYLSEAAQTEHTASVHATLAVAYEQRTATLVHALLSDSLVADGKYDDIQAEVRQRLGMTVDRKSKEEKNGD